MAKGNDSHQDSHQDTHKDVGGDRRMELITGTVCRRGWSAEERASIVAESFAPGANVAAVARRHCSSEEAAASGVAVSRGSPGTAVLSSVSRRSSRLIGSPIPWKKAVIPAGPPIASSTSGCE
jgi:hypothetical protein